jgi:hypothetical protein
VNTRTRASAADRVADVLLIDGGWLTTPGINLILPDMAPNTVRDALYQLETKGRVERRDRPLGDRPCPAAEWRASKEK